MESCFGSSLMAMFDTISYVKRVASLKSKRTVISIKDSAGTYDDLLWYMLQDVLSATDAKGLFAYKVVRIRITSQKGRHSATANIYTKPVKENMAKLGVKGVSRYNLRIRNTDKGIEARVVLDV